MSQVRGVNYFRRVADLIVAAHQEHFRSKSGLQWRCGDRNSYGQTRTNDPCSDVFWLA